MRSDALKTLPRKIKLIIIFVMVEKLKMRASTMMTRREFLNLAVRCLDCMRK